MIIVWKCKLYYGKCNSNMFFLNKFNKVEEENNIDKLDLRWGKVRY